MNVPKNRPGPADAMEAVRLANPKFTNYTSRTAVDAVGQFCRFQRNGLPHTQIPEALIECAKGLNEAQLDLFEQWIVNPNDVKGIPASVIGKANHDEHLRLVREQEDRLRNNQTQDDEKCTDSAPLETCPEEKLE